VHGMIFEFYISGWGWS